MTELFKRALRAGADENVVMNPSTICVIEAPLERSFGALRQPQDDEEESAEPQGSFVRENQSVFPVAIMTRPVWSWSPESGVEFGV